MSAVAIFFAALLATKPCPAPVCDKLDDATCAAKAVWVAVGKITRVTHHPAEHPLNKDFADFVFVPSRWEKKPLGATPEQISFRVGWCTNSKEPPADISGEFRFFGATAPHEGEANQYLEFRALKPAAKLEEPVRQHR